MNSGIYFLPFTMLITVAGAIFLVAVLDEFRICFKWWPNVSPEHKRLMAWLGIIATVILLIGLLGDMAAVYGWGIFRW